MNEKPTGELVASYQNGTLRMEVRKPEPVIVKDEGEDTKPAELDPREQRLNMYIVNPLIDPPVYHRARYNAAAYEYGLLEMLADVLEGEEPAELEPPKPAAETPADSANEDEATDG